MNFRYAVHDDIDTIMDIYADAREFMRANGNPDQWGDNYPQQSLIESDIDAKTLYVAYCNDEIIGCFFFRIGPDPTYAKIYDGEWIDDGTYGVIHRLAVKKHGRKVASGVYEFCQGLCKSIRIDTHRNNLPMQRSLEKNGFARCGIIHLASGDERIAYQKVI